MASLEAPWQSIARRKKTERKALIPSEWQLPAHFLPSDPPHPATGPQNVLSIPRKCGLLSPDEIALTEDYSIKSLLSAIASKRLTALSVATTFCKRAAIAHQLTNCVTEPLFPSAMSRAKELDAYLEKTGQPLGPLHGLPISVKDTFDIAGVDSSTGLAALCFKPAKSNAPLIDLLLSLGCVILAKTNVPQTLGSLDSENNVFGRTMNPINRLCTAGGSSGGEGVMVAMKACMIGIGTDVGGSIRVPAMCNGVYGFKPSEGRLPYGGQTLTSPAGMSKCGVQAVAGPIGRNMEDIDLLMRELVSRSAIWGEDCIPGSWPETNNTTGSGKNGEFVIGVLRSDGNCQPHPPILKMIDEVVGHLKKRPGAQVIELPTPKAWNRCQSVMNKLMGIEGGHYMADLIEATKEPLVPWQKNRFGRGKPKSLPQIAALQTQRSQLQREMLKIWTELDGQGRKRRKIDAIICPVAPHPVPEIDRYNAVGYTSSWVLLDYPAGTIPVRDFTEDDLELGKAIESKSLGSWDDRNRELWDEKTVDRKVYLGTPLSVQVVTPRLEDRRLAEAMVVVDAAIHGKGLKAKL